LPVEIQTATPFWSGSVYTPYLNIWNISLEVENRQVPALDTRTAPLS